MARISSRSETRILASSAESGSSSSSTFGPDRERAGERHALLLAAGELERVAAAELGQADQPQHLGDARRRSRPRAAPATFRPKATFCATVMLGNSA